MSWRNIYISKVGKLSTRNNRLVIKQEKEVSIPLKDIATIMIEERQVNITSALLSKISEYNIAVYICNEKHIPSGIYQPLNTYHRQLKILKMQMAFSSKYKKQVWKKLVSQKLYNQYLTLKIIGKDISELYNMSKSISPGDLDNKEATGAIIYFRNLFGEDFKRRRDNAINGGLNYGYTIIRGAIARSLVAHGFNTSLGMFHKNELNSFNLVDDFIEPYRSIVDLWVHLNMKNSSEVTKEDRINLYNLLNAKIYMDNKEYSVITSIEKMTTTFTEASIYESVKLLKLPTIYKL